MSRYSIFYKKRVKEYSDNESFKRDRQFMEWINQVEYLVMSKLKIELLELPDEMYMVNFESGTSSEDMAKQVIQNNSIFIEYSE
jgi:hypothetical protein